jgi:predicted Zn finger-like uncharacterized protein
MPEMIQSRCPNCRTAFQVPAEVVGKRIRCKKCQTVFTVDAAGSAPARAKPIAKPARPASTGPKPATAKPVSATPPPNATPKRPYEDDDDSGPPEYTVIPDDSDVARCPFCALELDPPDTLICLNCGYDLLERRRHDSKKVYQHTFGDYVVHHLPTAACLLIMGLMIALCVVCILYMGEWFEGSIFESDETDPNTGKKKYYLPPGFCTVWIVVPSLFIIWKCGVFAFKRIVFQWRPPDKIKK